ncbi:heme biosynthesis protein HemY [Immundisolibacter sp.]|uniref:heme biosynthesis protein HemY n=1 Tax=Immundisolibacter sp. TaxID=1934948 RepID=UPI0035623329
MRRLFWLLLAASAGVLAASKLAGQPGYLLLAWSDWRLEIRSLLLALVLLLVLFGVLHWLLGSTYRTRQALARRRLTRQMRRRQQAEADLSAGLLALLEGNYPQAQKTLQRGRRAAGAPELHALALAHLAQLRGDNLSREREYAAARAAAPAAGMAIAWLQASAQLAAGDAVGATATLHALGGHNSPRLLQLEAELARQRGDWQVLGETIPRLRRAGVIDATEANRQELACASQQLAGSEVPDLLWPQLPRRVRRESSVQLAYAKALRRAGRQDAAQEALVGLLNSDWQGAAVTEFGHFSGNEIERELARAEHWLAKHPKDPELLLALGRLALRARQWARAQAYFESSLLLKPDIQGHLELAELLQNTGQAEAAAEHYRSGLRLAVMPPGERPAQPDPRNFSLTAGAPAVDDQTVFMLPKV